MNSKISKYSIALFSAGILAVSPAFAQVGVGVDANVGAGANVNVGNSTNVNTNANVNASATGTVNSNSSGGSVRTTNQATTTGAKGVQAITARINSLNTLQARISNMERLTAAQKSALSATIQSEISDFMTLQTKLQTGGSTTLGVDFKSLGANGRLYALVEPQVSILAAINRVDNIVNMLKMVAGKLEVRIGQASTSEDVADLTEALADMNAELNEASAKASSSMSLVINLKPDNGNQTVQKTNLDAMKRARSTLRDAAQDLNDARRIAVMIMKDLNINASSTASVKSNANVR